MKVMQVVQAIQVIQVRDSRQCIAILFSERECIENYTHSSRVVLTVYRFNTLLLYKKECNLQVIQVMQVKQVVQVIKVIQEKQVLQKRPAHV